MTDIVETAEMVAESIADMFGLSNQGIRFVGLSPEESRAQKDSGLRDHAADAAADAAAHAAAERGQETIRWQAQTLLRLLTEAPVPATTNL